MKFRNWKSDTWLADDKAAHFGLGAIVYLCFARFFSPLVSFALMVVGVVVWELLEYSRYQKYGYSRQISDLVSIKDMLLGLAGALVAYLLT